jgi:hypothetical protein
VKRIALVSALALVLAGCGNGGRRSSPLTQQSLSSATSTATAPTTSSESVVTKRTAHATVRDAVRAALAANHSLAIRVLWTNEIPLAARRSTRGPALAEMAASAKDRQNKGIRVRMIHDDYRIISIVFGAAKTTASAMAEWDQRVVPSHLDGTPLGRPVTLHERARIQVRRAGASRNFVVWKVMLVK